MHRRTIYLFLSIACFCFGYSRASGRVLDNWPYKRLFKEADLVVIVTAVSAKDASDTFVDDHWPLEFVGRNTTMEVLQALKGEVRSKQIVVLHFRFGERHKKAIAKGEWAIIDGPLFVNFRTKPEKVEIAGMELFDHKFEYLLFLKKRADGRYEPVSGRIDPSLSIRELFEPFFSRDDGLGKEK
jgi:hypothetical protein